MKYPHNLRADLLAVVTYGSHLYGTSGPTSDFDFKAVVLPTYRQLILGQQLRVSRERYTADGEVVGEHETMPANGWEVELTPIQKFAHDFLGGQAYAMELVFAVVQGAHEKHLPPPGTPMSQLWHRFAELCRLLAKDFQHQNVNGMVGFAVKQTFDYVRRGERYNNALAVLDAVSRLQGVYCSGTQRDVRLDYKTSGTSTVFDELVKMTGLEVGQTLNHNKTMRTLKLNGREYLETTALEHFRGAVEKLVSQYGERSTKAAETDVDWKSLSHAVRVYQQVIEYLEHGFITFPRPNALALKAIKLGQVPLESVKDLLCDLDDSVQEKLKTSTLPTGAWLREKLDDVLFDWLSLEYQDLRPHFNV